MKTIVTIQLQHVTFVHSVITRKYLIKEIILQNTIQQIRTLYNDQDLICI